MILLGCVGVSGDGQQTPTPFRIASANTLTALIAGLIAGPAACRPDRFRPDPGRSRRDSSPCVSLRGGRSSLGPRHSFHRPSPQPDQRLDQSQAGDAIDSSRLENERGLRPGSWRSRSVVPASAAEHWTSEPARGRSVSATRVNPLAEAWRARSSRLILSPADRRCSGCRGSHREYLSRTQSSAYAVPMEKRP
jgi:hypothetical protein